MSTKQFLTGIIFLSFSIILKGQYLIEQNEKERITSNNVSVKTEWEHSIDEGSVDDKGNMTSVTKYNDAGDILEKISYRYNGDISSKENYGYDTKGQLIEFTRYDGRRQEYTVKRYTKYDSKGRKINENGLNGPDGKFSNYFKYNANNDLSEIYYYADNRLLEKRQIEYKNSSREIFVYNGADQLTQRIVKEVDANENTLSEDRYGPNGELKKQYKYKYDSRGNQIQEEQYYGDNLRLRIKRSFDAKNNLVKIVHELPDGTSFTNNIYTYDSTGNLMEEKWFNKKKEKFSSKRYKYNSRGNLIEANCYFANFNSQYLYKYQYELH